MRNIRAVFKLNEMLSHEFMPPGVISSEVGNVIPLIVGRPRKIHGVDLRATAKCRTSRIEDTQTIFGGASARIGLDG